MLNQAIANQANITAQNLALMFSTVDARLAAVSATVDTKIATALTAQTVALTATITSLNLTLRQSLSDCVSKKFGH